MVPTGQSNVRWRVNPQADRTSQHKTANCANRIDGGWFGAWRNTQFTWHTGWVDQKIGHNSSDFLFGLKLVTKFNPSHPAVSATKTGAHQVPCSVGQQSSPAITNANQREREWEKQQQKKNPRANQINLPDCCFSEPQSLPMARRGSPRGLWGWNNTTRPGVTIFAPHQTPAANYITIRSRGRIVPIWI